MRRPCRSRSITSYLPPDLIRHPSYVPRCADGAGALPKQEKGVRPARALPYVLHAHGTVDADDGSFRIDFG